MRWWVFGLMAYLFLAVQVGLSNFSIGTPYGDVQPQILIVLGVFVGLWAPPSVAMLSWGVLGVLMDLTSGVGVLDVETGLVTSFTLVGPYALGFLAGGLVLNETRSMLFKKHFLTLGAMTLVCGLVVQLIVVAVFAIRIWYEPRSGWSAVDEIMLRIMSLILNTVVAVALTWPLLTMAPLFGFVAHKVGAKRGRR